MKVTNGRNEVRRELRTPIRAQFLSALESYGFSRPDKFSIEYDTAREAYVLYASYGRISVRHIFANQYTQYPHVMEEIMELLAVDARIPIAEEL